MHRTTFVKLSALAFGLALVSFFVRGLSQLVVPIETATLLAAPTMTVALVLFVALVVQSVLAVTGVRPLDD